ncbi:unnamed protein product, partial [Ixodes pacificus]
GLVVKTCFHKRWNDLGCYEQSPLFYTIFWFIHLPRTSLPHPWTQAGSRDPFTTLLETCGYHKTLASQVHPSKHLSLASVQQEEPCSQRQGTQVGITRGIVTNTKSTGGRVSGGQLSRRTGNMSTAACIKVRSGKESSRRWASPLSRGGLLLG